MDVDGFELVECPAYRLLLTESACATNWSAVAGRPMHTLTRLHHCLGCSMGAGRAGKEAVPTPLPRFCCRCMRLSPRLMGRRLCPSCYNRERELRVGKNARGTDPIKITPVGQTAVRVSSNEKSHQVDLVAASRREVALHVLRTDVSALIVRHQHA
jgi:hypothetical protein